MGLLFGTDGIRGVANKDLTCDLANRTAMACTVYLARNKKRPHIIIGQDTRKSGDMLALAMAAGFCSCGADVTLLGVTPTPAVAFLVRHMEADAGVMISASHNPAPYNGIKIFSSDGYKLSDQAEEELEQMIYNGVTPPADTVPGAFVQNERAIDAYIRHVVSAADTDLSGMHITVDCANGAAYATARRIFESLGVHAHFFHDRPDGLNINRRCGSTHLEEASAQVLRCGAELGFSFDGDTDRCLAVDGSGRPISGDHILGVLALYLKKRRKLAKNAVAATVMSNMGFLSMLKEHGVDTHATRVGDRYVLEAMRSEGLSLGGESSGHVILLDKNTTGDGQLTAVMFMCALRGMGISPGQAADIFTPYPQAQYNVPASKEQKAFLAEDAAFLSAVEAASARLGDKGRVLVRPSGTEPKLRIMVEGVDADLVEELANSLVLLANKRIQECDSLLEV